MKFGASTWLWTSPLTTEKLEEMAPHVAELGFDLIEIPIEDPDLIDYPQAREIVQTHGLDVSICAVMSGERDLIHPDEEIRATGMAYVRECIEIADEMGSDRVVGPLYSAIGRCWQPTPEERREDEELLATQLGTLSEYADTNDVVLCVEPLNRFETSFLNLTSQVVEIVERVDHPACKILLDIFHLGIEEKDLGDAIRSAGSNLAHVQVSENDRGVPGTGHLPWDEVANALRDVDYEGPIVVESFNSESKDIARAAAVWRPLAPSPDAFARDGLQFLEELMRDHE